MLPLERLPACRSLLVDKDYESATIGRQIEATGAAPNIPLRANRQPCFSPVRYHERNAIQRMVGRLKDFRRIVTRYDRLDNHYIAAVCHAAPVS